MESNINIFMRTCNFIYAFHNSWSANYSYVGMHKTYNKMCDYKDDKHDLLLMNGYKIVNNCEDRKIYCKNVDIEKVVIETYVNIRKENFSLGICKEVYVDITFINKENHNEYAIKYYQNNFKLSEYDNAVISVLLNDSERNELKNYLNDIEILINSFLLSDIPDSINLKKEINLRRKVNGK